MIKIKHLLTTSFQMEKEILTLEKELRSSEDQYKSLQSFINNNTTTFSASVKPILLQRFPHKYMGKNGNQNLLRDMRYMKLTTNGNIPQKFRQLVNTKLRSNLPDRKYFHHIHVHSERS